MTGDRFTPQATQEQLQLAIDAADLGTWDLDLLTDTCSNRSLRHDQMFGYTVQQDAWSQAIAERHVIEEDKPIFRDAFRRALQTGLLSFEVRVRWPDGSVHWIAALGRTYHDESGKPVRMAGVVADVGARKQAQAALLESERRRSVLAQSLEVERALLETTRTSLAGQSRFLEATLSSIPDFVYAFNRDRRFVYVNRAMQELFGRTSEEMLGKSFSDLGYPPEIAAQLNGHIDTIFATGTTIHDEVFYTSPKGVSALFQFIWGPVLDEQGKVDMVVGVSRDQTERRRLEDHLRKSQSRYAFLLQMSDALRQLSDPIEIQATVSRMVGEHMQVNRVLIGEFVGEDMVVHQDYVDGVPSMAGRYPMSMFGGAYMQAYERNESLVVEDVSTDPCMEDIDRSTCGRTGVAGFIGTGLLRNGKVVAAFGVQSRLPRAWTEAEVALVREVGHRAWVEVERARAQAELKRSEARQAYLLKLSDALRPLSDVDEILAAATHVLSEQLGADRVFYCQMLEEQGRMYFQVIQDHHSPRVPSMKGRYPAEAYRTVSGACLWLGRSVSCPDVHEELASSPELLQRYLDLGIRSYIAVPLMKGGELRGVLAVHRAAPHQWSREDLVLAEETAERTWAALERARVKRALRESEARIRTIADLVPDLLWSNDSRGGANWVNGRWRAYTGQAGDEPLMEGWHAVIHPDDLPGVLACAQHAAQTQQPWQSEPRIRNARGEYRWHLVRVEPLCDETGAVREWFGSATDVHEKRALLDELEARVAARTGELEQASAVRLELLMHLERVQDEERRRIARELHDSLGQYVSSLMLAMGRLRQVVNEETTAARLQTLDTMLQGVDRELDRIVFSLRPTALEDCGLAEAIETYLVTWSGLTNASVDHMLHGLDRGERLSPRIEAAVFRVMQEALNNVGRHASATRVSVTLERRGNELIASVEDDGLGFDPEAMMNAPGTNHWGLLGMRERIEALGGTFALESQPGSGTTVLCRVPL